MTENFDHLEMTVEIVSAYVSHNPVGKDDLPALIRSVHAALGNTAAPVEPPAPELKPAVPIRQSVQPDFITCLEDGKQFKSLKRHLSAHYGLTPDEYREKWGLRADYPMVAPNYSATRSSLAKANGLGRKPLLQAVA